MITPHLSLSHSQIQKGQPTKVHALVQIKCTTPTTVSQVRKNLALAIDTSGSMSGLPLMQAVQGACALIDKLNSSDQLALVSYASQAQLLSPSVPCTEANKTMLKHKLHALTAMGGTALHEGWLRAAEQVAPFVSDFDLTRVILLSDGEANVGVCDVQQCAQEAVRLLSVGIGTSTYGVGINFNEVLMTALAQGGQSFYANTPDQLRSYFEGEFRLMDLVAIKDVRVSFPSHLRVLNDLPMIEGGVVLPDAVWGSETWCVLEWEATEKEDLTVEIGFKDGHKSYHHVLQVSLKAGKKEKRLENAVLQERVKELEASRLQKEALLEAKAGRWENVQNLVAQVQGMAHNNAYVAGVSQTLASLSVQRDLNLMSKEVAYATTTMSRRSVSLNEDVTSLDDQLGLKKASQGQACPPIQGE